MAETRRPPAALARILGHDFARLELLETALTHASAAAVEGAASYERLEFLGDRVVGLIVADLLMRRFPDEPVGDLARRLARLVDRDSMAGIAAGLDLGGFVRLSAGEQRSAGQFNRSILADAMEAVIGAIYRDGGLETARPLVERLWAPLLDDSGAPPTDPKTALQEWAQARSLGLPVYTVRDQTGPDHAPRFTVEVRLAARPPAVGEGGSKRAAESAAAAALLDRLEERGRDRRNR